MWHDLQDMIKQAELRRDAAHYRQDRVDENRWKIVRHKLEDVSMMVAGLEAEELDGLDPRKARPGRRPA